MSTLLRILLLLVLANGATAQLVKACVTINGVPNPANNEITVCNGSGNTISVTNCGSAPSSFVFYSWTNQKTNNTVNGSSVSAVDSSVWIARVRYYNGITDVSAYDTVHLHFHAAPPTLSISGPTGGQFNTSANNITKCKSSSGTVNVSPSNLSNYKWLCDDYPNNILSTASSLVLNYNNSYNASYHIEATDGNGCLATFPFTIAFTDNPFNTLNLDTLYRCLSDLSTITINNTSHALNTGINAIHNYTWKSGFPTAATVVSPSTSNNHTIVLKDGGIDNVNPKDTFPLPTTSIKYSARYTNLYGCYVDDEVVIYIVTVPIANAGNDTTICHGTAATLTGNATGGKPPYTYAWSSGATTANTSVSPTSSTTYVLSVTDDSGCGFSAQTDNVAVNVNPQLVLTACNDTSICRYPLGVASLNAIATGGTGGLQYSWLPENNLSNPAIANPTCDTKTTTTYMVTVKDALNCSTSEPITVVSYSPSIGTIPYPVVVTAGNPFTFDVSTGANTGFDFVWTDLSSNSVVSNSSAYEAIFVEKDTIEYQIVVTDPSNSCTKTDTATVWYQIVSSLAGLLDNPTSSILLYPNPSKGMVQLELPTQLPEELTIEVLDLMGRVCHAQTIESSGNSHVLDLSDVNPGVYTVRVQGSKGSFQGKVVLTR